MRLEDTSCGRLFVKVFRGLQAFDFFRQAGPISKVFVSDDDVLRRQIWSGQLATVVADKELALPV